MPLSLDGGKGRGKCAFGIKADLIGKLQGGAIVPQDTTEVVASESSQGRAAPGDLQLCALRYDARGSIPGPCRLPAPEPALRPRFAHARSDDVEGWAASPDICGYSTDHTDEDGDLRYSEALATGGLGAQATAADRRNCDGPYHQNTQPIRAERSGSGPAWRLSCNRCVQERVVPSL